MTRLIWIPRALIAALIVFVSLFAMDALEGNASVPQKLGALAMHLLPSLAFAGALALSWWWPIASGAAAAALGLAMCIAFHSRWDYVAFLIIGLPPIVGGLGLMLVGLRS